MQSLERKESELSDSELCRLLECGDGELNDFEEVDLSYSESDPVAPRYLAIPAMGRMNNLERLTICNHDISDLSPIRELVKLKYVDLSANKITDISPLTSLNLLQELHLDKNSIQCFPKDLYKLRNLQVLTLSHNKVTYESFQELLCLTELRSLDLTYNPVLMRDKENRRDVVFFLHNRLHRFELFNGIHINTLFTRVSCGNDYLDDITDFDVSSPYFYVAPHHILTIGERKNLLGKPVRGVRSPSSSRKNGISPFSLDDWPEEESKPSVEVKTGKQESHRNRSISMFECIHSFSLSPQGEVAKNTESQRDSLPAEGGRRQRGYSVHDAILHANQTESTESVASLRNESSNTHRSMFGFSYTAGNPSHEHLGVSAGFTKPQTHQKRNIFSFPRETSEPTATDAIMEELRKIKNMLGLINENQKSLKKSIEHLEKRLDEISAGMAPTKEKKETDMGFKLE